MSFIRKLLLLALYCDTFCQRCTVTVNVIDDQLEKRALMLYAVREGPICLDKSGYQVNIFLISPQKHVVVTH